MPLSYNQVQDEYQDFLSKLPEGHRKIDITRFAKEKDALTGTPERESAYDPTLLRKIGAGWERMTEATGLPQLGELTGRGITEKLGGGETMQDVVGGIGRMTPEMMTAGWLSAPMKVGKAASLINRATQATGYGIAGLTGANQISSNELGPQLAGAGINAATFGVANYLLPKAAGAAEGAMTKWLNRGQKPFVAPAVDAPVGETSRALLSKVNPEGLPVNRMRMLPPAAGAAALAGTTVGINEASRQGMLSAEGVPITDLEMRNPLTAENIVGNLAGLLPMAPTMAAGMRNRPQVDMAAMSGLSKWIQDRARFVEANEGVNTLLARDKGLDSAVENLRENYATDTTLIRSNIDIIKKYRMEGNTVKADETQRALASYLGERRSPQAIQAQAATQAEIARSAPPSNPTEMNRFISDLNRTIDAWNDLRDQSKSILKQLTDKNYSVVQDGESFSLLRQGVPVDVQSASWPIQKAFEDYTTAVQRGSKAHSSLAVDQLTKQGYLEPWTEERLAKEFKFAFDRSIGDYEMAYHTVLQKATEMTLDQVNGAITARDAAQKATTAFSPEQNVEFMNDLEYIKALEKVPDIEVTVPTKNEDGQWVQTKIRLIDAFALRDVQFSQPIKPNKAAGANAREFSYMPAWRESIISAMDTYNPETKTFKAKRKRVVDGKDTIVEVELPLDYLIARDENNNYLWTPKASEKFYGQQSAKVKGSLDDPAMQKADVDIDPDMTVDELAGVEQYKSRGGKMLFKDSAETGEQVGVVPGVDKPTPVDEFSSIRADSVREVFNKIASQPPEQLWTDVQPFFETVTKTGKTMSPDPTTKLMNEFRKSNIRLAMEAADEVLGMSLGDSLNANGPGERFLKLANSRKGTPYKGSQRTQAMLALQDFFRYGQRSGIENLRSILGKYGVGETGPVAGAEATGVDPRTQFSSKFVEDPQRSINPVQDLMTLARERIYKSLHDRGYSGDIVDLYTEVVAAVLTKTKTIPMDTYRVDPKLDSAGLASYRGAGRGVIGVDFDTQFKGAGIAHVDSVIRAMLHEIGHIQDYQVQNLVRQDAYSRQLSMFGKNLQDLAKVFTPEQRNVYIRSLEASLVPEQYRSGPMEASVAEAYGIDKGLRYGSQSAEEFTAKIREIVDYSLVKEAIGGKSKSVIDMVNVFDYTADEVREYVQGYVRSVGDVAGIVADWLRDESLMLKGAPRVIVPEFNKSLSLGFRAVAESAQLASRWRHADTLKAEAKNFIAANTNNGAYTPLSPRKYWTSDQSDIIKGVLPTMRNELSTQGEFAFKLADETYFPKKDPMLGATSGWKKFMPFFNLTQQMERQGITLARDVEFLARSIKAATNRGVSTIYDPFLTTDAQGKRVLDKANPLVRELQTNPNGLWRDAFNKASARQNEAGGQSMFIEQNGTIVINENFKSVWDDIRKRLTPHDQQVVQGMMVAVDKSYQREAQLMLGGLTDSIRNRLGLILMAKINRGKGGQMTYEQATQVAGKAMESLLAGQDASPVFGQFLDGDAVSDVQGFGLGLVNQLNLVRTTLEGRPGHRSESLPYDWILRYRTPDNEVKHLSAMTEKAAINLQNKLIAEGNKIEGVPIDRKRLGEYNHYEAPDELLAKFIQVEDKAWKDMVETTRKKYGEDIANDLMAYTPGETTLEAMQNRGLARFLKEQTGQVDRTRFDYLEGFEHQVPRVVSSINYRSVRQQLQMILNDPRAKAYPEFQKTIRDQFDYVFAPTAEWAHEMGSLVSGYYLGGNLSSAFVEMTQGPTLLVPVLINNAKSGGLVQGWKTMFAGIKDTVGFQQDLSWRKTAERFKDIAETDPSKMSLDETLAWAYQRGIADGTIDHGVIQDIAYSRDIGALQNSSFGLGKYTETSPSRLALDKAYIGMQHLMRLYSWSALMNNKISFFAGLRQGYNEGHRGKAAYDYAIRIKDLAQFGGGKANTPAFMGQWTNTNTRSVAQVMMTLQRFGFGTFTTYVTQAADAIGRNKNLTSGQRLQAKKAFGSLMATQIAIGGTFGLPFAGAAMTALEKIFPGLEVHKAVKETLAELGRNVSTIWTDDDSEQTASGAMLSDLALNGAGNALFGMDLSSRVGVSNLFGTSTYRGFNFADMAGPAPSIVENGIKALGLFGQGEPIKASRELIPQAFKNLVEMTDNKLKYGDIGFRDKGGSLLMQPTTPEAVMYGIGFRPSKLSAKRQAASMLLTSEQNAMTSRDRSYDQVARQVAQGDTMAAHRLVNEIAAVDPTINPKAVYRSIINRAIDMDYEKDLITRGASNNDANRLSIAQAFGPQIVPQRSEMEFLRRKEQIAAQLGRPDLVENSDYEQAMMVDELTRNRSMTRSQAVRLMEFMNQGPSARF